MFSYDEMNEFYRLFQKAEQMEIKRFGKFNYVLSIVK